MVEVGIVYKGKLRCQATHGQSGVELITDAPKDNMGEGASFSPTDLVGTALGTCMLTIMAISADRMGVNLEGTTVRVVKHMETSPVRRIGKIEVEFEIPAETTSEERQKLENAAKACPVHRSLHPDVEVALRFHWLDRVTA